MNIREPIHDEVQIELSDAELAALMAEATAKGMTLNDYVVSLVVQNLESNGYTVGPKFLELVQ